MHEVSAEVRRISSPLTASGRRHACPGEPLTFICEVYGSYIQWTFNSFYRTTFFFDQSVNTIRIVSGQQGVRAILIGNDALAGNPAADVRRLTSALTIDSTLSGDSHTINCSSNTGMQAEKFQAAGESCDSSIISLMVLHVN